MGWFGFLSGPPSRTKFAKLVAQQLRQAGATEALIYNAADFSLDDDSRETRHFLSNVYAEYCAASKTDRARVLASSVRAFASSRLQIPEEFEDARHDLMPIVRSRIYLEAAIRGVQKDPTKKGFEIPHQVIGESLCLMLAYDLPSSMTTVNDEQLATWGVTFYEALEAARTNLEETTKQVAQMGPLYLVSHGDSYDSSRLLLVDRLRRLEFKGDIVAMIPNRETLLLAGSEDQEALAMMAAMAKEPFEGPRSISAVPLRLVDDDWVEWAPPEDHPLHHEFKDLRLRTMGRDYAEQKEWLDKRHEAEGRDLFVASFSGMQQQSSGHIESYCVWTEGVATLLPRADTVMLAKQSAGGGPALAARGTWEDVQREVGHLMARVDCYPERWLVESFPTADELRRIGGA